MVSGPSRSTLAGLFREPQATWWRQASPATTYWRCDVPARRLPGQVLSLRPTDIERLGKDFAYPRQKGPAVWQFPGNTTRALMIAGMQQAGIPVFLEVDDNYLLDNPYGGKHWKARIDKGEIDATNREAHRKIVPWLNGVICATDALAYHYERLNPNTHVCRNAIEPLDWEEPDKPDDGVLRIGYAASDSHIADIRLIEQAFDWAARQPNVEIVLFGLRPETGYWARIPVHHVGWTDDLAQYRKSLEILDVGVCPLKSGQWADCKSDIKAMEYAMAGAMAIVSATEPYRHWADLPCLVASKPKDWLRAIKEVVANRDEVKRIAGEARAYVMAERTITDTVEEWHEAFASA